MTVKRSIETMFDLPAGIYCGVLMRKRLMKRVLKLQNEYERKLKELMASNLDELEIQNWTLNDNQKETGKQITGKYFMQESDREKLERIKLFSLSRAEKVDLLFEVETDNRMMASDLVKEELDKIALEQEELNNA